MASAKAEKFVQLLGSKLKDTSDILLEEDELREKLDSAVASLPSGALKEALQSDLLHYVQRLQWLLKQSSSESRTQKHSEAKNHTIFFCEEDYNSLLSSNNTTKLIEMPNGPPELFLQHQIEKDSNPKNDPIKVVKIVASLCSTLSQELATNGFISGSPCQQLPQNVIAVYIKKIVSFVKSWMELVKDKPSFHDFHCQRLQMVLSNLIKFLDFVGKLKQYTNDSPAFYTPPAIERCAISFEEAFAELNAYYIVLIIFYTTKEETLNYKDCDSESDDETGIRSSSSFVDSNVGAVLARACGFDTFWLVDLLIFASRLPRPAETNGESNSSKYSRLVFKALRQMSFQPSMNCQEFLRSVICLRAAKICLRSIRQANAKELSLVISQLFSMPIPSAMMNWLKLTSLGECFMTFINVLKCLIRKRFL
jgi:hypothetical protein